MPEGAFVMADALGFRGAWKRWDIERVSKKLIALSDNSQQHFATVIAEGERRAREFKSALERIHQGEMPVEELVKHRPEPLVTDAGVPFDVSMTSVRLSFLSDTIALGVFPDPPPDVTRRSQIEQFIRLHRNETAIRTAAILMSDLLRRGLADDPPFAYRGSITFGDCLIGGNFIVGPAVDTAANLERHAEGAFVWLSPSARAAMTPNAPPWYPLVPYRVPMKGGHRYFTYVVSPFGWKSSEAERREARERLLSSFERDEISVEIKRQHTETFLDFASEFIQRLADGKAPPPPP
jgi:class 3 adenylate cyclase